MEPTEMLVRAAALYLPIMMAIALALYRRPTRRRMAAVLLAVVWNLGSLLALNVVAVHLGWWSFHAERAVVAGVPVDLWIGWSILWGAVPVLAGVAGRRLLAAAALLVAADLVVMPWCEPVLVLHRSWLLGETVAAVAALVPGLALARWTDNDERLGWRVALQVVTFTTLVFYVLPSVIISVTDGSWTVLLDRPRWHFVVAAVLVAPFAAMALAAVREFAVNGGTPLPLDPPRRLVTTGPYAYVANPMQLGASVLLAAWGVLVSSTAVIGAAAMGVVFSAGLAAWNESGELTHRFGDDWARYRSTARVWLPRWRPIAGPPAVIYVAETCGPCSEVGRFIEGRNPIGLEVRAAEDCPDELRRVTYRRDAVVDAGVAAIARSLEHVHLGWAVAAWIARLPVIGWLLQLITDAVGGEPRPVARRALGPADDGSDVVSAEPGEHLVG